MTHHDGANHDRRPAEPALTRRRAVASIGAIGMVALSGHPAAARQDSTPESAPEALGEATMPDWRFSLLEIRDPYEGSLTKPDALPASIRVVGLQVILTNNSQQPMEFMVTDIRLRDLDGVEYRAGEYIGTEPRIVSQNLPDGERTRGWVWFGLPEAAEPMNVIFIAPAPVLRIPMG